METRLVGDIRFSSGISPLEGDRSYAASFIKELESLMDLYGVIKIDMCFDPYIPKKTINETN